VDGQSQAPPPYPQERPDTRCTGNWVGSTLKCSHSAHQLRSQKDRSKKTHKYTCLYTTCIGPHSRPHFTPGKDPVPIVQEAGWTPAAGACCWPLTPF